MRGLIGEGGDGMGGGDGGGGNGGGGVMDSWKLEGERGEG